MDRHDRRQRHRRRHRALRQLRRFPVHPTLGRHHLRQVADGLDSIVWDMEPFDDGSGESLFAGGFLSALVAFDGATWRYVGDSEHFVDGTIRTLQKFDDGSGPALYVAGEFTRVPGHLDVHHIARWNGTTWSPVGDGFDGIVLALTIFDDGSGPALYAAGDFTHSGPTPVSNIARWNGAAWEPVLAGLDDAARAMAPFSGADGRTSLVVAGDFTNAGASPAPSIAAIATCRCPADLDANGVLNLDDVNLFATSFVAADPLADLNADGALNLDDVNLFASAFAAGCA
ncbi:MAG: GC-type dockerin domain-anchored protein [Phycisphaerales bacterium]